MVREIQLADNISRLAILCRDNSQVISLQNELRSKLDQSEFKRITVTAGNPPKILPSWIAIMLYRFKTDSLSKGNFIKIYNSLASSGNFC